MRKITSFVLAVMLVFLLASCGGGGENAGQILGHDVHTADVMNGPKTKAIGTWAYIEMDRAEFDGLSDEQWMLIFDAVDGLDYNWFSILCGDGTGATFPGCSFMATVGKVDDDGAIIKAEKELLCPDGKLSIEKAEQKQEKEEQNDDKSEQKNEKTAKKDEKEEQPELAAKPENVEENLSVERSSALQKAKQYLSSSAFSHDSLIEQLEYEGFSNEDSVYAADNCEAIWSEQALKKAGEYLNSSSFSYTGLINQLEYEKFTHDDAVYAADNCGADWNEQAAKKAADYRSSNSFSHVELVEQLEYEGFTSEQAEYGASTTE